METSGSEDKYRFVSQYAFKPDPCTTNEDLNCLICKKLMYDPCRSTCGCHYCFKCIHSYMQSGKKQCPGTKPACQKGVFKLENDVWRDSGLNERIAKLEVLCPNDLCLAAVPLAKMEEHHRQCSRSPVLCPYSDLGCGHKEASKDDMSRHVHTDAQAHAELLIDTLMQTKTELDKLKCKFLKSCSDIAHMKEDAKKKDIEVKEIREQLGRVSAESKEREVQITSMAKEIKTLRKEIVDNSDNSKMIKKSDVKREETQIFSGREEPSPKEIGPICSSATKSPKQMTDIKPVVTIPEKISRDKTPTGIDKIKTTIDRFRNKNNSKPVYGTLNFTVDKFSTRGPDEEICSSYFYSHTDGYKFRLWLYPHHEGLKVPCMWVTFSMCKGAHDALLPWPCQHSIDICIVNQHNGKTHNNVTYKYSAVSDKNKAIFQRPVAKEMISQMYDTLVSHEDLHSSPGIIANDTITIRCTITAPS